MEPSIWFTININKFLLAIGCIVLGIMLLNLVWCFEYDTIIGITFLLQPILLIIYSIITELLCGKMIREALLVDLNAEIRKKYAN